MAEARMRGIAVVTGASSGIGAATARALTADGWRVLVGARRADRIEALAAEIAGRPPPVAAHAADAGGRPAAGGRFAAFARAGDEGEGPARGPSRLLVNNAGGAFGWAPVAEADE